MGTVNQSYFNRVKYTLSHPESGSLVIDEPIGWNNDEKEFARNEEYHGIFTNFSNSLKFIESGADFILLVDELYGINAQLRLTKDERHPKTDLWVRSYDGYLDLSTKEEEDNQVSVKFNSGGLEQLLKARESEQVEVDRLTSIDGGILDPLRVDTVLLEGRRVFLKTKYDVEKIENTVTLYNQTNGQTRGKTSPVPLHLLSKSHESAQSPINSTSIGNDTWDRSGNGETGLMFFAVSDLDRILHVKLNVSFKVNFLQFDDINFFRFWLRLATYKNASDYTFKENRTIFTDDNYNRLNGKTFTISFDQTITVLAGESLALVFDQNMDGKNGKSAHLEMLINNIECDFSMEEDSFREQSTSKFILAHELLNRLCEIATNKKGVFRSNYFGRKDLGYAEDGFGAYNGLTHGFWVRGFDKLPIPSETIINTFKPLTTSLKDCLASFSAIHNTGFGIEKVGYKEIAVVEDLKYFYNRNVTIRLPNQAKKVKRSVATKYYYSSVEIGYEKGGDYEEAMGLDEYNVKSTFTTAITRLKNVYTKISKYRADSYGKEFARRKPIILGDSLDTPYDNDVFIMDLKTSGINSFVERIYTDDFDKKPTGVFSPDTATSLRLSPLNMLFRHGWVVASGLVKYPTEKLRYASSKANSNLITKLKGKNEYAENGNIVNSELDLARYVPEYVEFEHVVDFEIMQQIEGFTVVLGKKIHNVYGLIEYINEKNEVERGWLINLKPNDKKWKVLKANR
jgi:hypothetical protein